MNLLLYRDYADKYDAKVDGQINDRMSSFLRWSQRKDIYFQQPTCRASLEGTTTALFMRSSRTPPSAITGW
jgi:hypothetical protein